MEKSQGITIGTVLAAAIFTHPLGGTHPTINAAALSAVKAATSIPGARVEGEGPWVASCQYWAPDRLASKDEPYKPDTVWAQAKGGYLEFDRRPENECGPELEKRWGFPAKIAAVGQGGAPSPQKPTSTKRKATLAAAKRAAKRVAAKPVSNDATPQIVAIIATVPDPVHTNLALQFDRTIDSLIEAAGDNAYVSSYYWLPWNEQQKKSVMEEVSEPNSSTEQEKQPGLIIFKPLSVNPRPGSSVNGEGFESAVYLFLVGETPTSGVNAYQMERALEMEDEFARYSADCKIRFSRSLKIPPKQSSSCVPGSAPSQDQLAIVGPSYTGAAASVRRAIDEEMCRHTEIKSAAVSGVTSTMLALKQLDYVAGGASIDGLSGTSRCGQRPINYRSFSPSADYDGEELSHRLGALYISRWSVVSLIEDDTSLGENTQRHTDLEHHGYSIRFPRGISLLRNAQTAQQASTSSESGSSSPSPYLHLSLKGSNVSDSVPHFSSELSPFSQEAQLMAIEHQLNRYRTKYIVISATDVLDDLFLAQFLHRVVPDARLVFDGGDLLFEREIDDVPFVGALTIGPYNLVGLSAPVRGLGNRAFPDWSSEAYYNAASSTFWSEEPKREDPKLDETKFPLAGYQNVLESSSELIRPPLWLTVIGTDGYYPIGIESPVPSVSNAILPAFRSPCRIGDPCHTPVPLPFRPPLAWDYLCGFIFLFCLLHSVLISTASYWSPMTRDLDVVRNDQPHRRALYINIGAVMLFSMAFVAAIPYAFAQGFIISDSFSWAVFVVTLVGGLIVLVATGLRTLPYCWPPNNVEYSAHIKFLNLIALATLICLVVLWMICLSFDTSDAPTHAGQFFAYRCLNPTSRVSPVVPVVMLLFGWYMWSIYQTLRLRFSECSRPVVPGVLPSNPQRSFVADWQLKQCAQSSHPCLYSNIECLLITVEVIQRFFTEPNAKRAARWSLAAVYFAAFATLTLLWAPLHSVDEILEGWLPSNFQFLITALFFPLLMIAVCGWIRMIMIWGSMKRDLLQRIENQPLRFAFCRIQNPGWISMLRQSGLREHWHDLSRSIESAQHLLNDRVVFESCNYPMVVAMTAMRNTISLEAQALRQIVDGKPVSPNAPPLYNACPSSGVQENPGQREGLLRMAALERNLAQFGELLLDYILIPYWNQEREGLVESAIPVEGEKRKKDTSASLDLYKDESDFIQAAEEFVAIRYISLIRAVLVNLRYLMFFIGLTFILTITAWNVYPFQPRQVVDWLFTALLLVLGGGVVWVLAQMHRDTLLSRITSTTPNELGFEFYVRLASVLALPVLTWLAYEFPDVGGAVFKVFQSGSEVIK